MRSEMLAEMARRAQRNIQEPLQSRQSEPTIGAMSIIGLAFGVGFIAGAAVVFVGLIGG